MNAVARVVEKKGREALLVMATGTGKTRVAAAIINLLSKAGRVKRVLFLADRNALIYQAKTNLNDYLPQLPAVDLTREKEDEGSRIVFSTYQTIINLIDGERDGDGRFYGVGHFDLIVFDEIHRSVYNRYRAIFEYFDGFRLGLTATPKAEGDKDTYGLFNLEPHNPTYSYELEQAVSDGFLVPPRAISVPTKFHREGIKYAELSDDEKLKFEEEFSNPLTGEFPDEIAAAALNSWLFNIDTVDKVIGHLMENGLKIEGGDRLGKTILFARSHDHALFIAERFNAQFPEYRGDFLKIIDHQEAYRYDLLAKFKDATRQPQIAVSIDMLDTGIDVPEVVNLVFFKPVRSSVKYWQMIGRGTRLCENLFGEGDHKRNFLIFDLCENFEFFGENPKGIETGNQKSLSQRLFELRIRLAQILFLENDGDDALKTFAAELMNRVIGQVQGLNLESFLVRKHLEIVEKYREAAAWSPLSDFEMHNIFRKIAPLVVETGEDESAKRFDAMLLDLMLFTQIGDGRKVKLQGNVATIASRLSKKAGTIPQISARLETLREVQLNEFWEVASVIALERVRLEMRDLLRFLDKSQQKPVFTDYEDLISGSEERPLVFSVNELDAYKRRVERYFKENEHHLTIVKLKNNQPISRAEIGELERMLFEQGELGTKEEFIQAFGEQPLGKFIRSIVGLSQRAAKEAFAELLGGQNFNVQQIRFIDTVINSFVQKGFVEPKMLFESPFTEGHSGGVLGLFDERNASKIIHLLDYVNGNAEAA